MDTNSEAYIFLEQYENNPEFREALDQYYSSLYEQVDEDQEDLEADEGENHEIVVSNSVDYTELLNSINTHLENIEYSQVVQGNDLYQIQENTYRLYYFIGGIYIAFAIVLAIRFLKIFF